MKEDSKLKEGSNYLLAFFEIKEVFHNFLII
jgi:hypothetical protein